jgi:hypothetical protein
MLRPALILALLLMLPHIAFADFGMPALRLFCPVAGGAIEIEPYIAWNDNNSRYKEFQVEQAESTCCHHANSDTSFFSYAWKDRDFIYTPCTAETRHLDIFVVRGTITVVEDGVAPIQNYEIGYVWTAAGGISYLRSKDRGSWQICEGSDVNEKEPVLCKELTGSSIGHTPAGHAPTILQK